MEKYMKIALEEAEKAFKKGEIPVGAVVVKNEKVICKTHNLKETKQLSTAHAEIIAINKACKKTENWRLNDCELYVTLEPCMMCSGAIIQSRFSTVIYGTKNLNDGCSDILEKNNIRVFSGICEEECQKLMKDFFVKKRNQSL